MAQNLLTAQTGNATGSSVTWDGGFGSLVADGDWDSGTVTLQVSVAGGAWVPANVHAAAATDVTIAADGVVDFRIGNGVELRAVVTGSSDTSGATGITASVVRDFA